MSEQKGGEEEPEREAEGAAGALVGICYDLLVLFIRPFLVRNVTGLIKQLVRHQKHDSAVRVVQERERESERSRYALTASHWDGDCRRRLLIRPIWYELLVLHPPPPPSAPTRLLLPYLLLLLLDPKNTKKSRRRRNP